MACGGLGGSEDAAGTSDFTASAGTLGGTGMAFTTGGRVANEPNVTAGADALRRCHLGGAAAATIAIWPSSVELCPGSSRQKCRLSQSVAGGTAQGRLC
jgi:hypothetical protein